MVKAAAIFLFGAVLLAHWSLAMFTDTGPGEFAREISTEMGVKNNLSLVMPSGALTFIFGAVFGFGDPDSVFEIICGSISAFFLLVMLVGFLPISLPAWMYPEWHVEWRRRRRRERLAGENSWRDTSRMGPEERSSSERPASPDDL
ncbi:hypothetical protein DRB06_04185 [Actinomyces sp. Z5]|uniref:hypothetical protein n=1 Tax=Actinomyces sp. Z5 TaxID=2250216 RepID=UPI000DCE2C67|nr:hypothetical protein [Actinomyces sp. Z5]RAX22209.1 hypothetical protein DRB06_04185 [Actinomyces sp. Z5]